MAIKRFNEPGRAHLNTSKTLSTEVQGVTLASTQLALTSVLQRISPWQCGIVASAAGALARNAQGDFSYNRTAAGAETLYFVAHVPRCKVAAGKTVTLKKIHAAYELGVADATSVDMLVDDVTYAQATDPVVATHGGAIVDGSYDANHDTATKRKDRTVTGGEHVLFVTLPSPAEVASLYKFVVVQLVVVLQNTGTLKFRGFTLEYDDNTNIP